MNDCSDSPLISEQCPSFEEFYIALFLGATKLAIRMRYNWHMLGLIVWLAKLETAHREIERLNRIG